MSTSDPQRARRSLISYSGGYRRYYVARFQILGLDHASTVFMRIVPRPTCFE